MGEIYVETYRGCEIYLYTPPTVSSDQYGSPCITGRFYTITAVYKRICAATGGAWDDGECTELPEDPDPPMPEDYLVETYRDVEVWWISSINMYRAQVSEGYIATGLTLPEIRTEIDAIILFLNPEEDPSDGLFAQVTAAVKAWVLANIPDWIYEWGSIVNNYLTEVYETIYNTYNYITETVNNVYNTVNEYISNTYNYVTEAITNVYNNFTEYITNQYITTNEYVTNIIGSSVEWVEERLADNRAWMINYAKLMDPMGLLKDPIGYIKAAFDLQREIAGNAMAKSFYEGLEEGLSEEGT